VALFSWRALVTGLLTFITDNPPKRVGRSASEIWISVLLAAQAASANDRRIVGRQLLSTDSVYCGSGIVQRHQSRYLSFVMVHVRNSVPCLRRTITGG
jgi:hypothetical protein